MRAGTLMILCVGFALHSFSAETDSASRLPDIGIGDPRLLLYFFPNIGPIAGGFSIWKYEGSNDAREGYIYGDANDKDWKKLRLIFRTPQMPGLPIELDMHHLYPYGSGRAFVRTRTFNLEREARDRKPVDNPFFVLTERGVVVEAKPMSEMDVNAEFQLAEGLRFIGKVDDFVFYRMIGNEHQIFGRAQRTYKWELPEAYLIIGALRGSGGTFRFVYFRSGLGSGRLVETEFTLKDALP